MQRASSDLKLNPHLHAVFLDGVYVPAANAAPEFRERRGVITLDWDADSDVLCVSEELAERDPPLAQLAVAAVSGLAPAGPELRRKPRELAFAGRPGVVIAAPLSVREVVSTLRRAVRALGGELEVTAVVGGKRVKLSV